MLYDKNRVRQRIEKKMEEDLQKQGYTKDWDFFDTEKEYEDFMTLQDEEFEEYLKIITVIDEDKWHFYIADDVIEKIIEPNKDLSDMYEYVGIDESLEQAKEEKIIYGFKQLSNDLWLIRGMNEKLILEI